MPIVPLRELGAAGVITDVDPFELPINSFSFAKNVRFTGGRVERGSVFRLKGAVTGNPKKLLSYRMLSGADQTLFVRDDGHILKWEIGQAHIDKSPASGWSPATSSVQPTVCLLNNVLYVNRPDRLPWSRPMDSDGLFAAIPTNDVGTAGWHTDWRCKVLRSLKGVLIAANVTKGANSYPNLVKWSNFSTELNMIPPDWDYANTTSNAGENTLADMDGPIVDAIPLRNRMYLYGERETWSMEFIGGNDMFSFDRQFDKGTMGVNCTVEVGGIHYVFGTNDLWMHDGSGDKSIATNKVREFVYDGLIKSRSDDFFVTFNPKTDEVIFCYVSSDKHIKWPFTGSVGCNRAAIYNITNGTWTFADLPYVTSSALTIPATGEPFDSKTVSWADIGGSFQSLESEKKLNLTFSGASGPSGTGVAAALRTFEPFKAGASSASLDLTANSGSYLEREGVDVDELKLSLRGYKLISSIYPQGRLDPDAAALVFTFGVSDHPTEAPVFGESQTYDATWYKLDFNQAGRFLSYKIEQTDFNWFSLSGIDFDLSILGQY